MTSVNPCEQDPDPPLVTLVGVMPSGERVMVEVWWDGSGRLATQPAGARSFGPPVRLEKAPDDTGPS